MPTPVRDRYLNAKRRAIAAGFNTPWHLTLTPEDFKDPSGQRLDLRVYEGPHATSSVLWMHDSKKMRLVPFKLDEETP